MVVGQDLDEWEINFYKGIASQFQVDTQGVHIMNSKHNQLPQNGQGFGVYKTMEVKDIYNISSEYSCKS